MEVKELRRWLDKHAMKIFRFMDYEAELESEEDFYDTLDSWFNTGTNWRNTGHRFVHLGIDGTGGQIAAWLRPGNTEPPPIVMFGSEGGFGVLAPTPEAWAQALAHHVFIDEFGEPACLMMHDEDEDEDEDEEERKETQKALAAYRKAVKTRFGSLPDLDHLIGDLDELNEEFAEWLEAL